MNVGTYQVESKTEQLVNKTTIAHNISLTSDGAGAGVQPRVTLMNLTSEVANGFVTGKSYAIILNEAESE